MKLVFHWGQISNMKMNTYLNHLRDSVAMHCRQEGMSAESNLQLVLNFYFSPISPLANSDELFTPLWSEFTVWLTLFMIHCGVRAHLYCQFITTPHFRSYHSQHFHCTFKVIGMHYHTLLAFLIVEKKLSPIWKILRVQCVPANILSMVSNTNV